MKKLYCFLFVILYVFLITGCKKANTAGTDEAVSGIVATEYTGPGTKGSSTPGSTGSTGGQGNDSSVVTPGVITAGEWNDLENWSYWLGLMEKPDWKDKQDYWKLYLTRRFSLQLTDQNNSYIQDAEISISDEINTWKLKTDNSGKAEFFPALFTNSTANSYFVKAKINGQEFDLGSFSALVPVITKQLNIDRINVNDADIMFVTDATGSMGDELSYLQNELNDVLFRAKSELPGINVRTSGVFYRDEGDEYLTKSFPFTTNVNSLINFIKDQKADGGGDFPEAVHMGLKDALQQDWSSSAITRLLFLVLDAPPHHEDSIMQSLQSSITLAQQKGIKIIPITASGIDKETEFMMRFLAIATNGSYVFITDDSGIGNTHLQPTVGNYKVEFLNNLILRLIKKYSKR